MSPRAATPCSASALTSWALLAALLAGCTDDARPPILTMPGDAAADAALDAATAPDVAPDVSEPGDATPGDASATPPATSAGVQLRWVLAVLDGEVSPASLDDANLGAHFTAAFLRAVPPATLRATFSQLSDAYAPVTLAAIEAGATDTALVADVVTASGRYVRVQVHTDGAVTGRMSGLLFTQAPSVDPALSSWERFDARFAAVAPRAHMLAAEVTSGRCVPVHAVSSSTQGPLGSEFKLYVLSALAAQVAAGARAWSDPLAIRDDWKSLPSGTWQMLAAGTTHTLQEFATQMISVSDNTATDHLLRTVGRADVEAAVAASGHAMPSRDVPFPTTRELFQLKLGVSESDRVAYVAGDAGQRRAYLDTVLAGMSLAAATRAAPGWTTPVHIDDIEWFASPDDVCSVFARLRAQAEAPGGAPVYGVLSVNPGLPLDARVFPYVGYKGGSEPGVLTMSWLLRRDDGRWFVVSTAYSDPARAIDEEGAQYLSLAATVLVGRHD